MQHIYKNIYIFPPQRWGGLCHSPLRPLDKEGFFFFFFSHSGILKRIRLFCGSDTVLPVSLALHPKKGDFGVREGVKLNIYIYYIYIFINKKKEKKINNPQLNCR